MSVMNKYSMGYGAIEVVCTVAYIMYSHGLSLWHELNEVNVPKRKVNKREDAINHHTHIRCECFSRHTDEISERYHKNLQPHLFGYESSLHFFPLTTVVLICTYALMHCMCASEKGKLY